MSNIQSELPEPEALKDKAAEERQSAASTPAGSNSADGLAAGRGDDAVNLAAGRGDSADGLAAGRGENAIELKEVEGLSQGRIVFRRFVRHRGAMISLFVLLAIVLLVTTSVGWGPIPGWWRYDHIEMLPVYNLEPLGAPTMGWQDGSWVFGPHPFGQTNVGRDVFAMVMVGTQQSLTVMVIIGFIATLVGVLLGSIAGFFRGWADTVIMRFTDMITIIPTILIGAIMGRLLGQANAWSLGLALSLMTWPLMARLVRSQFFALRELEFVDAARVAGASNRRIMFKHILPNSVGVIIVNATLLMSSAILLETALSFLGFGITPPGVSLGTMISEYRSAFQTRPWLFWWPGLFIILIALCINFIGDGLRDAFDPRQRRIPTKRALAKADAKAARRQAGKTQSDKPQAAPSQGSPATAQGPQAQATQAQGRHASAAPGTPGPAQPSTGA